MNKPRFSPVTRLFSLFLVFTLTNLMVGGPMVGVVYARQAGIEEHNQEILKRLGVGKPLSETEIKARVQAARAKVKATRADYRAKEARAQRESQEIAGETRAHHLESLLEGLSKRSKELQDLIADLRDGRQIRLPLLSARLVMYRDHLRETLKMFAKDDVRSVAVSAGLDEGFRRGLVERLQAVVDAMDVLPDDPTRVTPAQIEQVKNNVADVFTRFEQTRQPPPRKGVKRHPRALGFDPVRGEVIREPVKPPALKMAERRDPRDYDELFLLFGDDAILPIEKPGHAGAGSAAKVQSPPTSSDLSETPETRITAEIQALADSMNGDPLDIFNYVVRNYDYEPYYGSRDGASGVLSHGYGNDMDTASLLIALYRANGIPARYEYGSVEMTIDQVLGLTGTDDINTATTILASEGMPVVMMYGGSEPMVKMERTWVKAYVPYANYRGVPAIGEDGGSSQWVTLDPSYKMHTVKNRVDVRGMGTFDIAAYIDQSPSVSPLEFFADDLRQTLRDQGMTCPTLEDGRHILVPEPREYAFLPTQLPYIQYSTPVAASSLPSSLRYTIRIEMTDEYGWPSISKTFNLPEIFGKRLALTFPSSSSTLDSNLNGYGTITLSLDDVVQATGDSVQAGTELVSYTYVTRPGNSTYVRTHEPFAGGTYVYNLEFGYVNPDRIEAVEDEINALKDAGASQKKIDRRIAQLAGLRYTQNLYNDDKLMFDLAGFYHSPQYECMTAAEVSPKYFWGLPNGAYADGYSVDAEETLFGAPRNGPFVMADLAALISQSGWTGSYWEHAMWGIVVNAYALSTTNILQISKSQGQQIYFLNSYDDYTAIASQLSHGSDVIANVQNTLAAGGNVIIHQHTLNYQGRSISGYLLGDPDTGAGQYLIYDTVGGGQTTEAEVIGWIIGITGCVITVLSDVNTSSGNLILNYRDMELSAIGPSLTIERTYNSTDTESTAIGYGWGWSFGGRLKINSSSGEVTYITPTGERHIYTPDGSGYSRPSGLVSTLTKVSGGYDLEDMEHDTIHHFNNSGVLQSQTDLSGNTITLHYSGTGDIQSITDALDREVYTFTTSSGLITHIEDLTGRSLDYAYDDGLLTSMTNAAGETWTYTYFSDGAIGEVRGPDGKPNRYAFDGSNRLVQYGDDTGRTAYLAYDDLLKRTTHTTLDGAVTVYVFDENGECIETIDQSGNQEKRTYNDDGNMTSYTDGRGQTSEWELDNDGNITNATTADGTQLEVAYDGSGRQTSISNGATVAYDDTSGTKLVTTPDGRSTTYQYNDRGQVSGIDREDGSSVAVTFDSATGKVNGFEQTDPDGDQSASSLELNELGQITGFSANGQEAMTVSYDEKGQMMTMTDSEGSAVGLDYDSRGNMTGFHDDEGRSESFVYDYDLLVSSTDSEGRTSSYEYDHRGRKTGETDPLGRKRWTEYDLAGRVTRQSDFRGNITEYGWCADVGSDPCDMIDSAGNLVQREFDENGRILSETSDLGTMAFTWDKTGHLTSLTDRLGNTTTYIYNDLDKLESVEDPLGKVTHYTYDSRGRLATVTDALDRVTTYQYNTLGQLVSETDAEGNTTTYAYHANGQRKGATFPDGSRLARGFSTKGQISTETFFEPGGAATLARTFSHDGYGRLTRAANDAADIGYAYDEETGGLTLATDTTLGRSISRTYDPITGKIASMSRPDGTQSFTYDMQGNLMTVTSPGGGVFRYAYDQYDRVTSVTYPNGIVEHRSYDAYGRLEARYYQKGTGSVIAGTGYAYDGMDRVITGTDETGQATHYTYDAKGQLLSVDGPYESLTYEYDAVGNRTGVYESGQKIGSCTYNTLNQATSCTRDGATTNYSYDGRGNLVQETSPSGTTLYTYDEANELVSATGPSGSASFTYDALGRRASKTDSDGTHYYLYDQQELAMELNADGDPERSYVRAPGVDQLLAFRDLRGASPVEAYYHQDGRYNVMAISNASGQLSNRYHYGANGSILEQTGSLENSLTFAGRPFDPELNKYHFRARLLDPEQGRFLQRDPYNLASVKEQRTGLSALMSLSSGEGEAGLLMNPLANHPYAFARNAPANFWDPSGENDIVFFLIVAASLATVTVAIGSNYFPLIYANYLAGDAYTSSIGITSIQDYVNALLDMDWLKMYLSIWAVSLRYILDDMKSQLVDDSGAVQLEFAKCTGYAQKLLGKLKDKLKDLLHIADLTPSPIQMVFLAYISYFLLLDYVMIDLFQMPSYTVNIPVACSCKSGP